MEKIDCEEDLGIDGRIILKLILNEWNWIGRSSKLFRFHKMLGIS
jgi:hypothetical protein